MAPKKLVREDNVWWWPRAGAPGTAPRTPAATPLQEAREHRAGTAPSAGARGQRCLSKRAGVEKGGVGGGGGGGGGSEIGRKPACRSNRCSLGLVSVLT